MTHHTLVDKCRHSSHSGLGANGVGRPHAESQIPGLVFTAILIFAAVTWQSISNRE
jgi:hypothetical protein